jgi:hypothetical protein
MVAPQPVSLRPFYERITEILGIADRIDDIDREIQLITSFTMDQMSPIGYAKNVRVPTFIIQVHDDALTKPSDVQQIFDNIPVNDKKLFWIKPLVCAPRVWRERRTGRYCNGSAPTRRALPIAHRIGACNASKKVRKVK